MLTINTYAYGRGPSGGHWGHRVLTSDRISRPSSYSRRSSKNYQFRTQPIHKWNELCWVRFDCHFWI